MWIFFISFNRWHQHSVTYCQYFTPFHLYYALPLICSYS